MPTEPPTTRRARVLPRDHRLTRSEDFRSVVRSGTRAGARTLVVHLRASGGPAAPIAGFVVSKAVGDSVTRHLVSRRLRHLVAGRIDALPRGSALVVRALPSAAGARSEELGADLDRCLSRVLDRSSRPSVSAAPAVGPGGGAAS